MQSLVDNKENIEIQKAILILFAAGLNALEFFIPKIPLFPWLKPGIANIITIIWIIKYGAIDAIIFSILRIWIVGFYFGFSFISLFLAMSGGIASSCIMGGLWHYLGKRGYIGTIGIGIFGAVFHNLAQLISIYFLLSFNLNFLYQIPFMLFASLIFGSLTGYLAYKSFSFFEFNFVSTFNKKILINNLPPYKKTDFFFNLLIIIACFALVFSNSYQILLSSALGATFLCLLLNKGSLLRAILKPIRYGWIIFVFIALINISFSYGINIPKFPLLTYESLHTTLKQWLKLWTWINVTELLSYFNFNSVMFFLFKNIFRNNIQTILSGLLALQYFPLVTQKTKDYIKTKLYYFSKYFLEKRNYPAIKLNNNGFIFSIYLKLYEIISKEINTNKNH
jgi:heptaprenyl diphosphate synthase